MTSDEQSQRTKHEDVETYSGSPRMPNFGFLVCSLRGHNWVSDGMTDYSCERCGLTRPAWRVNDSTGIRHQAVAPDGSDVYVCDTCGSMFEVYQDQHEEPTRCPWGEFHE